MRNTRKNPDQDNWKGLVSGINTGMLLTIASAGDVAAFLGTVSEIRVEENVNVQTTRAQLLQALLAAMARNQQILFDGIALKAAVRAAPTAEAKQAVWDNSDWA